MQRLLSFDQTPPLSVPLRFFLTAPLFSLAAALLLFWKGPEALVSRWSPLTLTLTHLLTLGFLAMSMIGSLVQIMPVVAGIEVPRPRLTASVVHLFLTFGTATLAAGFWLEATALFKTALPLLLSAFAWLLGACIHGLWCASDNSATIKAIRLALAALAITVSLGMAAASAFAWPLPLPLMQITDLHAAWGLLGWVGLLIIGVAYQVVPMFQVTPVYPQLVTRRLASALFILLTGWSAAVAIWPDQPAWGRMLPFALICCGLAAFSLATLYLLRQRKRPKPDATTMFWRTGLISLLLCAVLGITGELLPQVSAAPSYPFMIGILFIVGFAYSVINGMLYKIVPFLVWYHLQSRIPGGCGKVPNVKQIVPDHAAEKQFGAYLAALVLLIAATLWPDGLARPAALVFGISSCWLWLNMIGAVCIYRRMFTRLSQQAVEMAG